MFSKRIGVLSVLACGLAAAAVTIAAQAKPQPAAPAKLGALAPANLTKARPPAPFNLTGTWQHDGRANTWKFVPPTFKLTPEAQAHYERGQKALKEGGIYRDDIGQCWPAGLPLIMTRVWPIAVVQMPTVVYMISGFMNSVRMIYLDGRSHTPEDEVVRTFNGESIGRWEGDTLIVDTVGFLPGYISSPAPHSDKLHVVERFEVDVPNLKITRSYTADDPVYFKGQYTGRDTVGIADQPYITDQCSELGFIDYSKQQAGK
jgi:hypothetical protein